MNELRKKIDEIDANIAELLLKRLDLTNEIGNIKNMKNIDIYDENREKEVLFNVKSKSKTKKDEYILTEIYKKILEFSKKSQEENL